MNNFEEFVKAITAIHEKHPELRIMQLIVNATGDGPFIYYMKDEDVIIRLKQLYTTVFKDDNT